MSRYLLSCFSPPQYGRCGIFGAPGSGKTSLLAEVLTLYAKRAIWLMPDALGMPDAWRSRWVTDKGAILRRCVNGQAWIPSLDLTDWCLSAAWELGECMIVVDEAHNIWHRELGRRDGRMRVLLEGRRRGICVVMATQRPALLHPIAQNVMVSYAIGTATMAADADLFRRLVGLRSPMPLHKFMLYNPSCDPQSVVIPSRRMS